MKSTVCPKKTQPFTKKDMNDPYQTKISFVIYLYGLFQNERRYENSTLGFLSVSNQIGLSCHASFSPMILMVETNYPILGSVQYVPKN